jgi:hypothetical protein
MRCRRCGSNIMDFMWVGDDHPVLVDAPIQLTRNDNLADNTITITASVKITRQMCSEVKPTGTIHSQHSVDGYPMCMPTEYWDTRTFQASTNDSEVSCGKCIKILEQMYKEIGNEK